MDAMEVLLVVWGVLTTVLAVLLIYRGTLSMHEDDQLFLDSSESILEKEQRELTLRINRLRPYVQGLAASSGALILLMAGLWLWRGLH
jgi:hypothetical protein